MQADAETPAEEEEPPVVEGDGAIENLGTEEFDTVVHNVLEGLENEGGVVGGVVGGA